MTQAKGTRGPRKQRTRQHIIADLSIHHVERFILEAGHTAQRLGSDYGYDLLVTTFDEHGFVEPGSIYFQFKAMETLKASGTDYVYDLDVRDYNLWIREKMPVIFVLFDAVRRRAHWLAMQPHFGGAIGRTRRGTKTVRIRVPMGQVVNHQAIEKMRQLKRSVIEPEWVAES
jgi:hypothetical protein